MRLLAEWTPAFPEYFLCYPSRRQIPPVLAALIATLRRWRVRAETQRRIAPITPHQLTCVSM